MSEVSADFRRMGWGVVENSYHDLGTDLFVLARDARLFDLGLVVGVQVKAGHSYFDEPQHDDDGDLSGWWFRDDDRAHIDAWLQHGLPHLVVLHDLEARVSYWVHVTEDRVVSTGKGAKLLVPIANTVGESHRDALEAVAAVNRPTLTWEGSAWTTRDNLLPRELLRHALVVPRLVAPHPNAGTDSGLSPEQAVALLVQARVTDLTHFAAKHAEVPTLEEARQSSDWSWRFVGALGQRLMSGEVDALLATVEDAPTPHTRAAATVTAAATLMEDARSDQAIELLARTLDRDEAEPVDHAWLRAQYARAGAEVGRLQEARAAAVDVQQVRITHPNDLTASAVAGTAAMLLFTTSGFGQQDLQAVVRGVDTAAGWWRAQTTSQGLGVLAERMFKGWARDTSLTLGGGDPVNDQLLAASLTASHAGDHGGWRHLSSLLGQTALLQVHRATEPQVARSGLAVLRLAGDSDALTLAVQRLVTDGPAVSVSLDD